VIEHNRLEAEATGEPHHLRDRGLLESALVLMAGIARAHAFEQANKRTAFEAMWHFLRLNGYDLAIEDSRPWADEIIALVERRSSEEDFVRAVRPFVIVDK